ncbi:MAG: glycoside hydrolase [Acutalibacteraceae bacterium]
MERASIKKLIYRISLMLYVMATVAGWFGVKADHIMLKFDTICQEQEITGWGTSAAWWSQMAGKSEKADDYAKLLYSEDGLGLNVYRYNVGAGEKENPNSRLDRNSWRSTESFLVYDEQSGEYVYDWTQDAAAQNMLDLCMSYGCIDTVVLFANSPHYSMTVSGQASGGLQPAVSNLREDCYDDFAKYMLDIAEYFIGKGVPVKYISPINESQWDWGGDWVGQEGCHYELDEIIEVGKAFAAEIKQRGLDVKLSLAESGAICDLTVDCIDKIYENQDIVDVLGTYSYHSYWSGDPLLKSAYGSYMKKNYPKTHLEMSEWCELPCETTTDQIEGALIMARTIAEDTALTGVNSWSSWVAVNENEVYADSMIGASYDCNSYTVAKRYYALAHFSKFVPVGSHAVDFDISVGDITAEKAWWTQEIDGEEYPVYLIENKMTVSTFKTPDGDYVAVVVNEGEDKKISYCMPFFSVKAYTTDSERNLELSYEGSGMFGGVSIPANSITTIVFEK